MKNKFYFSLLSAFLIILKSSLFVQAQSGSGSLQGKIYNPENGETLPFVNIVIERNGLTVAQGVTDIDGKFNIKPIPPGTYDLKAATMGFSPVTLRGVVINDGKITFADVKMQSSSTVLVGTTIEDYKIPLIEKDNTTSGGTVGREEIAKMSGRSVNAVAATVGGVYSNSNGDLNIRGARGNATDTYIDGVKVRGSSALPKGAIEQVSVQTGGLDPQYGDVTGGVVSVTTRGPSREYAGGIELVSSDMFDKYGYRLLGFNVTGPLLTRKNAIDTTMRESILGFLVSGEVAYAKDQRPSAIGNWRVKEDVLESLENDPLRPSGLGTGSFQNSEFIRLSDLEKTKFRQNADRMDITVQGKIDVKTTSSTNLTFGATYDYVNRVNVDYRNAMFNWKNNTNRIDNTWRVYSRFTQRFSNDTSNTNTIKNAFYFIQVDFSQENIKIEDKDHKDKFFDYGYVGKFDTYSIKTFQYGTDSSTGLQGQIMNAFDDTLVTFTPSDLNPVAANQTSDYFGLYESTLGNYEDLTQVQDGGGILNGRNARRSGVDVNNVYDMWYNVGQEMNQYYIEKNNQFRISASGSADIKNHAFIIGFEYEQRVDRGYSASPVGLWTTARSLTNFHIQQLDLAHPILVTDDNGVFMDTIIYDRLVGDDQSYFDYNLRNKLGLPTNGTDWIDLDSLPPDMLSIDYFAPDELLNQNLALYYGYDHTGKKLSTVPSFDDFFTAKDDFGNFKREVDAFRPIYMAGYIKDKFAFNDLIFNVGLRVDRFDANQKVLKDPYSFFETKKAGEVDEMQGQSVVHPSNIGDDFVVYVSDIDNPGESSIVGYRDGDTWYNDEGVEISDPKVLKTSTGIAPYLVDPTKKTALEMNSSGFKDYEPQVVFMPRISFSFPISDEALFYAHYDILAQRPSDGIRLNPIDYLFIASSYIITNPLSNPALKPSKTIDYELGFKQKLSSSSVLTLSVFYREQRDDIQVITRTEAFPQTYNTYGNIDFGTVKGLTLSYDLRKTANLRLRTAYTLQFAEGTGSGFESGLNLVNSGQPNLRTIAPYSFDQRHTILTSLDYSYGSGADYNGPVLFGKQIFANAGANFTINTGSGRPYSKKRSIVSEGLFNQVGNNRLEGSINGSTLPWQVSVDARVDKSFTLKFGKGNDDNKKTANLNVYIQVLNLLNTKNVIEIYGYTGNPDDDGYLSAAEYQAGIEASNDPQSFRDLYTKKVNNPANYAMPRRMRLGVQLDF